MGIGHFGTNNIIMKKVKGREVEDCLGVFIAFFFFFFFDPICDVLKLLTMVHYIQITQFFG